MSYCRQEGKDKIIFVTKEDHETPSSAELIADDPNDPYEDHGDIWVPPMILCGSLSSVFDDLYDTNGCFRTGQCQCQTAADRTMNAQIHQFCHLRGGFGGAALSKAATDHEEIENIPWYYRKLCVGSIHYVTGNEYCGIWVPGVCADDDGLILPNGDINWNCPCLGGMASGPCGEQFKSAFSCFHYSEAEIKGSDCLEQFRAMQECMQKYPELYPQEDDEEEEKPSKDTQADPTEASVIEEEASS